MIFILNVNGILILPIKADYYSVTVVKNPPNRRLRFSLQVGKIPWRRKRQPTPVFLPGESHGQRRLVGYSSRGRKELDMT